MGARQGRGGRRVPTPWGEMPPRTRNIERPYLWRPWRKQRDVPGIDGPPRGAKRPEMARARPRSWGYVTENQSSVGDSLFVQRPPCQDPGGPLVARGRRRFQSYGRTFTPERLDILWRIVEWDETLYLDEIRNLFGEITGRYVSISTIARACREINLTRKKVGARGTRASLERRSPVL